MVTHRSWIGFLLFLQSLLLMSAVLGQEELPHFRATTNLTMIDVRVLDQNGKPVQGLTAEDFVLQEEGITQKISYFREIALPLNVTKIESVPPVESEMPTVSEPPAEPSEFPDPEKRLLVFLFDLSSAGLQDIAMMGKAAEEFLQEQFTVYDSAAVLVMDNGLELVTDFTSDPIVLGQAFGNLTTGDPELDASEEDESSTEFVADETEFALFQTNQQLSAIQSVADAFREVPGRKALLYFSSGMRSGGIENDEQLRWTTDACNRANMSIYSVDARGLVALSPGGGAHRSDGRGTSIYSGRSSLNQMATLVESQNTLVTLSVDTGGAALVDDNDFSKLLRQAMEESSHYYLLGYYVPEPPKDGRFRRVEVRTEITYGKVLSRPGYYAEKPYRALSREEREFKLLEAVVDDLPIAELPLSISAEYFPDERSQYHVAVLLSFDYSELSILAGAEDLNLEIIIVARDQRDRARAAVRDKLEIRSKEQNDRTRFVYENLLVMEPGEYQISAYVRENRTGKMSKTIHPLALPPDAPVRLSSLVLAGRWEKMEKKTSYRVKSGEQLSILDNPLLVAGRSLVPRVNASFNPSETIYVHGKVNVQDPSLSLQYRIVLVNEDNQKLFEGLWKALTSNPKQLVEINARLPLNQLAPGQYQITAELRESDTATRSLTRSFTVVSDQKTTDNSAI